MTDGLDDVYESAGVYNKPHDAYIYNVETIIKEAIDGGNKREYLMSRHNMVIYCLPFWHASDYFLGFKQG